MPAARLRWMAVVVMLVGWGAVEAQAGPAGLRPENVLVVYNQGSVDSEAMARYYLRTRHIPKNQLCAIDVDREAYALSLDVYRERVLGVIQQHIEREKLKGQIRCVVVMPDVPEGVATGLTGRADYVALDSLLASMSGTVKPMVENPYARLCRMGRSLAPTGFTATVQEACGGMMLVSRVDGPGLLAMKHMLDSARKEEQLAEAGKPFRGTFYIDLHTHGKPMDAYNGVLEQCAAIAKDLGDEVVLERTNERLKQFDAGPAIFYTGWYTLNTTINRGQNNWAPGAIAMEIHSESARNLRSADNPDDWLNSYVAFFVKNGVAGTVGAFREPYLVAFPRPDEMLVAMRTGLTWGESYWCSVPHYDWEMLMLGDPLYRPFAEKLP